MNRRSSESLGFRRCPACEYPDLLCAGRKRVLWICVKCGTFFDNLNKIVSDPGGFWKRRMAKSLIRARDEIVARQTPIEVQTIQQELGGLCKS